MKKTGGVKVSRSALRIHFPNGIQQWSSCQNLPLSLFWGSFVSNTEIKAQYLHVNVSTIWQSQIALLPSFSLRSLSGLWETVWLVRREIRVISQTQSCYSTLLLFAYPASFSHAVCGYSHGRFGLGWQVILFQKCMLVERAGRIQFCSSILFSVTEQK